MHGTAAGLTLYHKKGRVGDRLQSKKRPAGSEPVTPCEKGSFGDGDGDAVLLSISGKK